MKHCTACKQDKTQSEFGPYARARDGLFSHCKQCVAARARAWRAANIERARAADRARTPQKIAAQRAKRLTDPEGAKARDVARYHDNREAILTRQRESYHANIESKRRYQVEYRRARPELARLWYSNRRLSKSNATPKWADHSLIGKAYEAADLLMQVTGDWYEVDHIVPLRGAIARKQVVCGLHVEYNLQVIPRSENRAKSNIHWPDMPGII